LTQFELMEIVANYEERMERLYNFWVTVTFAFIVAAYVVGPELGWLLGTGVAVLYSVIAFSNAYLLSLGAKTLVGATNDLGKLVAAGDSTSEAVIAVSTVNSRLLTPLAMSIQIVGTLSALGYALYRLSSG